MTDVADWSRDLPRLAAEEWAAYLTERSGLPGPRANLTLAREAALRADASAIEALLADGGEYPVMCAAAATGRRADEEADERRARELTRDERWRVREGVVLGLQLLGDTKPEALAALVRNWAEVPDALVQRAAAAAICEPRLLRDPAMAATSVEVCRRATAYLRAVPVAARRRDDIRTLRQTLGYCWSVAVAAAGEEGLDAFRRLDTSDPDMAWIVRENQRKKRFPAEE